MPATGLIPLMFFERPRPRTTKLLSVRPPVCENRPTTGMRRRRMSAAAPQRTNRSPSMSTATVEGRIGRGRLIDRIVRLRAERAARRRAAARVRLDRGLQRSPPRRHGISPRRQRPSSPPRALLTRRFSQSSAAPPFCLWQATPSGPATRCRRARQRRDDRFRQVPGSRSPPPCRAVRRLSAAFRHRPAAAPRPAVPASSAGLPRRSRRHVADRHHSRCCPSTSTSGPKRAWPERSSVRCTPSPPGSGTG